jgi:hypothetical protein
MGGCIKVVFKIIFYFLEKKKFGGGKILAKDFAILLPKKVTLFAPKCCPHVDR